MKKRVLIGVLAATMLIAFAGCSTKTNNNATTQPQTQAQTTEKETTTKTATVEDYYGSSLDMIENVGSSGSVDLSAYSSIVMKCDGNDVTYVYILKDGYKLSNEDALAESLAGSSLGVGSLLESECGVMPTSVVYKYYLADGTETFSFEVAKDNLVAK